MSSIFKAQFNLNKWITKAFDGEIIAEVFNDETIAKAFDIETIPKVFNNETIAIARDFNPYPYMYFTTCDGDVTPN